MEAQATACLIKLPENTQDLNVSTSVFLVLWGVSGVMTAYLSPGCFRKQLLSYQH